ncbi:MAG: tetratricopeptide repeat protein [Peptoclostridium sp.]|uniref:tetratricopeptide repeat protein n=1 Tax=Peptoclostridium sp. TaxID=1904860 RepID=UPI00139D6E94|nr:tetratricopeptide repeat protein [Peptoclostridium sp.]MZQ75411.1 tetratricopeptide repeat protein [Peptoclostridium sp.]
MKSRIEKYLMEMTREISFITIEKSEELLLSGYNVPAKGLDVPVLTSELSELIKNGKAINGISAASIIKGIVYMLGIDPQFPSNAEYRKLLEALGTDIKGYIQTQGVNLANAGNLKAAAVYFKALLELDEKNINGIYNYALVCQDISKDCAQRGEVKAAADYSKEARQAFELVVEEYPDFAKGYYNLGFYYFRAGDYARAKDTWQKAIDNGIEDEFIGEIEELLGVCGEKFDIQDGINMVLEGDPQGGLEMLLPHVNKHGGDWKLLFFAGLAYRQLGEVDEAQLYFGDILKLDPQNADAMVELGLCSAVKGELDESLSYFKKALELRPDNPEILCNIGMTYLSIGDLQSAREHILRSYELDPEDEITIECMKELEKNENR